MEFRQLELSNGLRCHLHHQPDARDAAALIRVQAGSLNEPDGWPGLAHLLEHLLFCDSSRFSGSERLMPWIQQQAGLVNATTKLNATAFFYQLPAASLSAGVERLSDMVVEPLLSISAIKQECAVIDAEYRLLQNHADTLSEAALLDLFGAEFQRFRVGNHASFGDDAEKLQDALQGFHQRYYRAGTMQLWLHGPQSLDELARVAEKFAAGLPAGGEVSWSKFPEKSHDRLLQLAGDESFWLTLMVSRDEHSRRNNIALLNSFWSDEASGSLLAQLRLEGLCEKFDIQWLWQSANHGLLALRFSAAQLTPVMAQRIKQRFLQHLQAIRDTDNIQRKHYTQLANKDLSSLTPMAQLRSRALDCAPASKVPEDFEHFIAALPHQISACMLTQNSVPEGEPYATQGFDMVVARWKTESLAPLDKAFFRFYPQKMSEALPLLPLTEQPLPLIAPVQPVETLLLRPAFFHTSEDDEALALQRRLRPILAELRHAGGSGDWQQLHGVWQLVLNLPEKSDKALLSIQQAIVALNIESKNQPTAVTQTIAIRELLAALPGHLIKPAVQTAWMAAWCGQQQHTRLQAAHLLSNFRLKLVTHVEPPALQQGNAPIACSGNDHALLVFIPLLDADEQHLAALRALALILEPRFFQQFRVDQQIGYVASARYQRVADIDGLLLALQSPEINWRTLLSHCKRFMRAQHKDFDSITPAMMDNAKFTLRSQCHALTNADAIVQALRQQHNLPNLNLEAIESLTLPQLQQLHQNLIRTRHLWRVLFAI